MSATRYLVNYGWMFDMVVDIDRAVMTDEKLHEINRFWSGDIERVREARGDVLNAVLKMLGVTAFRMTITEWDAIEQFKVKGVEGWPLLDGSEGMTLVSLDDFELDDEEITIREQA